LTEGLDLEHAVLDALRSDADVLGVVLLRSKTETFVVGCRDTRDQTWGRMMFVVALEEPRGSLGTLGHQRLQRLKGQVSAGSDTAGAAWYGVASTVRTSLRISRGEAQIEPPEG
jgi:hypothetical protein